jgi:hypothetical protein
VRDCEDEAPVDALDVYDDLDDCLADGGCDGAGSECAQQECAELLVECRGDGPLGAEDCSGILACREACEDGDCRRACVADASDGARGAYHSYRSCLADFECGDDDADCVADNCSEEAAACL